MSPKSDPPEHNILNVDERTEINHRQVIAEIEEDVFPAYRDKGVTLGETIIIFNLLRIYNQLLDIEDALK